MRHLGKEPEAIGFLSKAIETGPATGNFYYERAKCYHALGDKMKRDADLNMAEKYKITVESYLRQ